MIVKLLTEHQLEFLSLKGGCRGSSASTQCKNATSIVGKLMPRLNYYYTDLYLLGMALHVQLDLN